MLSSDLEDSERDRAALSKVLSTCLEELKLDQMVTVHDFPVLLQSSQPIRLKKKTKANTDLVTQITKWLKPAYDIY